VGVVSSEILHKDAPSVLPGLVLLPLFPKVSPQLFYSCYGARQLHSSLQSILFSSPSDSAAYLPLFSFGNHMFKGNSDGLDLIASGNSSPSSSSARLRRHLSEETRPPSPSLLPLRAKGNSPLLCSDSSTSYFPVLSPVFPPSFPFTWYPTPSAI